MKFVWMLVFIAFILELLSLSTGMGFGTKLAPILFLLGYSPLQVVPTILLTQVVTGLVAGIFHNEFKNVAISFSPLNTTTKVIILLTSIGCLCISFSIFLTYVLVQPPTLIISSIASIIVILGGIISLIKTKIQVLQGKKEDLQRLTGFGALAGFIKGIGGSGYGPILTIGQISSGIYEKSAIGIMPLAESGVAAVGIISLFLFRGGGINLVLLPSIFTGSYFAAMFSPYLVRCVPNRVWKVAIPSSAFLVGSISLIKIVFL